MANLPDNRDRADQLGGRGLKPAPGQVLGFGEDIRSEHETVGGDNDLDSHISVLHSATRAGLYELSGTTDRDVSDTLHLNERNVSGIYPEGTKYYVSGGTAGGLKGKIIRRTGADFSPGGTDVTEADFWANFSTYWETLLDDANVQAELNADAIESLEAKTADLHAGNIIPSGWSDANAADGGLDRGPGGSTRPDQTYARAVSTWADEINRRGSYFVVRIRAGLPPAHARTRYTSQPTSSGRILHYDYLLSSLRKIGESANSNWVYYINSVPLGIAVATVTLQTASSTDHVGTSRFDGDLSKAEQVLDLAQASRSTADRGKLLAIKSDDEDDLELIESPSGTDQTARDAAASAQSAATAAQTAAVAAQTDATRALADAVTAQTTADAALPKAGGTMTGKIVLDGAPTADLHAASKKYVDDNAGAVDATARAAAGRTYEAFHVKIADYDAVKADDRGDVIWMELPNAQTSNITLKLPSLVVGDAGWFCGVYKQSPANQFGTVTVTDNAGTTLSQLHNQGEFEEWTWGGSTWHRTAQTGAQVPDGSIGSNKFTRNAAINALAAPLWSTLSGTIPKGFVVEHNDFFFISRGSHEKQATGPDGDPANWWDLGEWWGVISTQKYYPEGATGKTGSGETLKLWRASEFILDTDPLPTHEDNTKWKQVWPSEGGGSSEQLATGLQKLGGITGQNGGVFVEVADFDFSTIEDDSNLYMFRVAFDIGTRRIRRSSGFVTGSELVAARGATGVAPGAIGVAELDYTHSVSIFNRVWAEAVFYRARNTDDTKLMLGWRDASTAGGTNATAGSVEIELFRVLGGGKGVKGDKGDKGDKGEDGGRLAFDQIGQDTDHDYVAQLTPTTISMPTEAGLYGIQFTENDHIHLFTLAALLAKTRNSSGTDSATDANSLTFGDYHLGRSESPDRINVGWEVQNNQTVTLYRVGSTVDTALQDQIDDLDDKLDRVQADIGAFHRTISPDWQRRSGNAGEIGAYGLTLHNVKAGQVYDVEALVNIPDLPNGTYDTQFYFGVFYDANNIGRTIPFSGDDFHGDRQHSGDLGYIWEDANGRFLEKPDTTTGLRPSDMAGYVKSTADNTTIKTAPAQWEAKKDSDSVRIWLYAWSRLTGTSENAIHDGSGTFRAVHGFSIAHPDNAIVKDELLWEHTAQSSDWHNSSGPQLGSGVSTKIYEGIGGDNPWRGFEAEVKWTETIQGVGHEHVGLITFPGWRSGTILSARPVRLHGQGRIGGEQNTSTMNAVLKLVSRNDERTNPSHLFIEGFNTPGDTGIGAATQITVKLYGVR